MNLGKSGIRVLGVAESYKTDTSVLCGVVMRGDDRIDGFGFETATVGGLDMTDSIVDLYRDLEREDIHAILISGLAPSWYNIVDLDTVNERTGLPVVCVTYEESEGLEGAIKREFKGEEAERRLDLYRHQKERERIHLSTGKYVFVRPVGLENTQADRLVDRFTTHGKKPEPIRIARLAARAADGWRHA